MARRPSSDKVHHPPQLRACYPIPKSYATIKVVNTANFVLAQDFDPLGRVSPDFKFLKYQYVSLLALGTLFSKRQLSSPIPPMQIDR